MKIATGLMAAVLAMGLTFTLAEDKKDDQQNTRSKQRTTESRDRADSQQDKQTERLWQQIAEAHKQLVEMEVAKADKNPASRTGARTSATDRARDAARDATDDARDATDKPRDRADRADRRTAADRTARNRTRESDNPQADRLWEKIGRLNAQIIELQVDSKKKSGRFSSTDGAASTKTAAAENDAADDKAGPATRTAAKPDFTRAEGDEALAKEWRRISQELLERQVAKATGSKDDSRFTPGSRSSRTRSERSKKDGDADDDN